MLALALALILTTPPAPLAALQPYVGHCWIAEIAADTTDRHCFTAVYGGVHIRDDHVVTHKGKAVYRGETIYSAEAGRLTFTYWNSLGGVGHGTATTVEGGLRFELAMRASPDAAPQAGVSTWRRTAAGYDATTDGVTRRFRRKD